MILFNVFRFLFNFIAPHLILTIFDLVNLGDLADLGAFGAQLLGHSSWGTVPKAQFQFPGHSSKQKASGCGLQFWSAIGHVRLIFGRVCF